MQNNKRNKGMMMAILSLSLLTVMAGAAVAPALGTIREHFAESSDTTVQLIISMPALFIFLSSFIFPKLCQKLGARTLVMIGLIFLPNDLIADRKTGEAKHSSVEKAESPFRKYLIYIAAMFVLMSTFFLYPSNYALETASAGIMSQQMIATVMALLSAAMYMGQFLSPFIMSLITAIFGGLGLPHLPFCFGVLLAIILAVLASRMSRAESTSSSSKL